MGWCSCVSLLFSRSLTAVERRDSWDGRVHLLAGHLRPGEQRLRQLLHQTGALSSISHHRASPHCQQHWKNPTRRDAHEAWKKTQWLPLTPGLFFCSLSGLKSLKKGLQSLIWETRVCIRGDFVWNGDTVFFGPDFRWNNLPDGLFPPQCSLYLKFSSPFFCLYFPFWWEEKKSFRGYLVFLTLFHLFWMGVHLVRVVKIYIETVYSYMYDIHIKRIYKYLNV